MDFSLSEEQIMIRDSVRDFAERELLPKYQHWGPVLLRIRLQATYKQVFQRFVL